MLNTMKRHFKIITVFKDIIFFSEGKKYYKSDKTSKSS